MKIKVQGGTAQLGGESLCVTCRHAAIVQGPALRDRIVNCAEIYGPRAYIPFPVLQCSSYDDKRQPSLREMQQAAWILRTDSRRESIGFVRAAELKERERSRILDDLD